MPVTIGSTVYVRPSYSRADRVHGPATVNGVSGTFYRVTCKGKELQCVESELEVGFASWGEVLAFIGENEWPLRYHAPMDLNSQSVDVVKVYKNGKIAFRCGDMRFNADASHLERMRKRL